LLRIWDFDPKFTTKKHFSPLWAKFIICLIKLQAVSWFLWPLSSNFYTRVRLSPFLPNFIHRNAWQHDVKGILWWGIQRSHKRPFAFNTDQRI